MREVCKSWKEGFESSVTGIRVQSCGPLLPFTGPEAAHLRFLRVTSLNLGSSFMASTALQNFSGFRKLSSLTLGVIGAEYFPFGSKPLFRTLTAEALHHLRKIPLKSLNLRGCNRLEEPSLENLQGLPLTGLNLSGCRLGLGPIHGMPLRVLSLGWGKHISQMPVWQSLGICR